MIMQSLALKSAIKMGAIHRRLRGYSQASPAAPVSWRWSSRSSHAGLLKVVGLTLCLSACAGGLGYLKQQDVRLGVLKSVVEESLPKKLLKTSPNGREFFSNYFIIADGFHRLARGGEAVRYQARVVISGSQPPYDVRIRVERHELQKSGRYRVAGHEKKITRALQRRIQSKLVARRHNNNIIEDFRAF